MRKTDKAILILGGLLIGCSLALLVLLQVRTTQAERANAEIVRTMETILTDRREGTKDPERETEMPALELQGEDFIALLEIPSYGLKLPVCSTWDKGKVISYPCRFHGSAYDGTLVVGGYDQSGQFDFFGRIYPGAAVTLTDMTGSTFSYEVARVDRSGSAPAEILLDGDADLTLFVRDAQALEYLILRCVEK